MDIIIVNHNAMKKGFLGPVSNTGLKLVFFIMAIDFNPNALKSFTVVLHFGNKNFKYLKWS